MDDKTTNESAHILKNLLEKLTGQKAPIDSDIAGRAANLLENDCPGLGYSQFNELLLSLGYDRITHAFFQYLVDGEVHYKPKASISSIEHLSYRVDEFRKLSMLFFGNIKYGFKLLSNNADELNYRLELLEPIPPSRFELRHDPIHPITEIKGEDTYYLGYIIQSEVEQLSRENPGSLEAIELENRRKEIVKIGKENYKAYLASDHLDVYVATSMRKRHEYYFVNNLVNKIFNHNELKPLKLRWFDPTQAYCDHRIDKGLFEALMLRRAKCTVYFVQETDTLGKDSELASTLAQGKTVIAFIPEVDNNYVKLFLENLLSLHPDQNEYQIVLEQLKLFKPYDAWEDNEIQEWVRTPDKYDLERAKFRLRDIIKDHYDKRAKTLAETHPLGIQVNLNTGVANGVLVVRSVEDCAKLIRHVVMDSMEFTLEENLGYICLRENISKCVYRVVTNDQLLTNTFWNFYP